jgi:putative DNA primase/helicase
MNAHMQSPRLATEGYAGNLGLTEEPQDKPASIADQVLRAALAYTARGWPVFPVRNKAPLVEHGFKDATRDRDQIAAWWRRWPRADVAVPTGAATGLVVLDIDIDPTKGINGLDALEEIGISTHPATPTAHTPRGGLHLYFAHPGGEIRNSAGRIGRNIDVRGDGGSIIVPSGQPGRSWDPHLGLNTPLAPMPAWMMPKVADIPARHHPSREIRLSAYCEAALDGAVKAITSATEGTRRTTLNRECFSIGQLAGSGALQPSIALDVLTWAGRQIPGFASHHPDRIVRDAFTDGLRQPREVPDGR